MKKSRCLLLTICILICIGIMYAVHLFTRLPDFNFTISNPFLFESGNYIALLSDNYYCVSGNGIVDIDGNLVVDSPKELLIYANDDKLYTYSYTDGVLSVYNEDIERICTFEALKGCSSLCVADNFVIMSNNADIIVYDVSANFSRCSLADDFETKEYNHCSTIYSLAKLSDKYSLLFTEGKVSYSIYNSITDATEYIYHTGYEPIAYKADDTLIFSGALNSSKLSFYLNEGSFVDSRYLCTPIDYAYCNGICYGIGQTTNNDQELKTNDYEKHSQSNVFIVDCRSGQIVCDNITKNERELLLCIGSEKAITYYNGEYLTYSLEDWKVIDKQDADEIKDGGSYFFEACGEYLFVFDDKTDKLINKLKV